MSFVYWTPNSDGDWSSAANWSNSTLPGSGDFVTVSTTSLHTVTHSTGSDAIARLTVGNDNVSVTGGSLTITQSATLANAFGIYGGFVSVGGTLGVAGAFTANGGTITLATGATIGGGYNQAGGSVLATGTVAVTGTAQIQGGYFGGSGTLAVGGTTTLAGWTLGNAAVLRNAGVANQTGNVTLGDSLGVGATILNLAGSTYDFANAVTLGNNAATAQFVNGGVLASLAGTGQSIVAVQVASTGTVSIGAGSTLSFRGALTSLAGSVVGAGTLAFGGGSATIAAGTTLGVGALALTGAGTTLSLGGSLSVASGYTQTDGSSLVLNGVTLTVSGPTAISQGNGSPTITGTGSLVTTGAVSLGGGTPVVIGGSLTWSNAGLLASSGTLVLGNSQTVAASFANQKTGAFDLVANGARISNGSVPGSTLTNAGTLAMTAPGGTGYVDVAVTSTGTVASGTGDNLQFDGPTTTLSGALTGAGQISFGGGASSIAAGTTVSVAAIALYNTGSSLKLGGGSIGGSLTTYNGTTLTLGANVTVVGAFTENGGSTILLGGHQLTLSGTSLLQYFGGAGTVSTAGTTTVEGGTTIGGSVGWLNRGLVLEAGNIQVGDTSTVAASVTNMTAGTFDIVAGNVHTYNGSTPISGFTNAGLLEFTANGAGQNFYLNTTSTGTIVSAAGDNFEFDGTTNSVSGTITGAGQVSFANGGTTTIAGGTKVNVGTLALYNNGSTLALAGSVTVAGGWYSYYNSVVSLGANTLTLAGPATFQNYGGTPLVTGSGTLATTGTTSLYGGGTALTIGGTATWANSGTVLLAQTVQLGNGNAAAAMVNAAGGTIDITGVNFAAFSQGSAPPSVLTNAGLLELTANNSGVSVGVNVTSTGTIASLAGDNLEFDGNNSVSGRITGAGQVSFGGGSSTIAGATTVDVGTLQLYHNGTTLALLGNVTVAGSWLSDYNSTVALGAATLTLAGPAHFQNYGGSTTVGGTGTLLTQATTTLDGGGTAITIGGTATWRNTGTVLLGQQVLLGNGPAAAAMLNGANGTIDITGVNFEAFASGSSSVSTLTNAGLLELTASGSGVSVFTDVVSTGTVSVVAGDNLEFDGPANTFSGALTGAGQVAFGQGTSTIAAGTTVSVGTLAIYRSNGGVNTAVQTLGSLALGGALAISSYSQLTLGGNTNVAGAYSQRDGSVVTLGGFTLTLAGAASFTQSNGAPLVTGGGTLAMSGTTTLGGGTPLTLGGSVVWSNSGLVYDSGNVQVGNTNTATAALVNTATGTFDIIAGGVSLYSGSNPASSISNAGLIEMTVNGSSSISLALANTGTVLVDAGSLSLSGGVTGHGTIAVSGGGNVALSGTIGTGQTLKFLDLASSAAITLASPTSFAGTVTGFGAGDTIDLTNISNATAVFNTGTLTFTDNTSHATVAVLRFTGAPHFSFASDGHGGTLITDPPAGGAARAAYFTNSGSGTETIALGGEAPTRVVGFSYAHPDVLDLRGALAGTPLARDLASAASHLATTDAGGNTTLWLDQGGTSTALATLVGVTTSTNELMAHHALLLG